MEVLVSLGVVSVFLVIFVGASSNITALKLSRSRAIASFLVQQEVEAIRNTPYASLTNRTDAPFMNVPYAAGDWSVVADATAPSQPNAYRAAAPAGNPTGLTNVAIFPSGKQDDATIEASVKVLGGSPASWKAGVIFRHKDSNTYYWARIRSADATLGKVVNGTSTTLFTKTQTFSTNSWYALKVVTSGSTMNLYADGILLTTTPVTDTSIDAGATSLAVWDSALARFDTAKLTTTVGTKTWNFDGGSEIPGSVAIGWKRLTPAALTNAVQKITIADAVGGQTGLKNVRVRLEWNDGSLARSEEVTTLVSLAGIGS